MFLSFRGIIHHDSQRSHAMHDESQKSPRSNSKSFAHIPGCFVYPVAAGLWILAVYLTPNRNPSSSTNVVLHLTFLNTFKITTQDSHFSSRFAHSINSWSSLASITIRVPLSTLWHILWRLFNLTGTGRKVWSCSWMLVYITNTVEESALWRVKVNEIERKV